jgi:beta-glucanase (GH16 family)
MSDQRLPGHELDKPRPDARSARPDRVYPGDPKYRPLPQPRSVRSDPPQPMTLTPDWRNVFNDHFFNSNVDMEKWWTRYVYNNGTLDYLNDEWERYRESGNHVLDSSLCHLVTQKHNGEFWPSGMLRSKDCYNIGNGDEWYFESRMKVPEFLGSWSAFWIAGSERNPGDDQSVPWPPEIDQCEIVNNGKDDTTHMLHCCGQVLDWNANPQQYAGTWAADGFNWDYMYYWSDADLSKGFHTYGLWYKKPEFVVYLDRKPILAANYDWVADDRQPMNCYLFANLAVGGQWAGRYGVDDAALPQSLDIDYIRVYQRVRQSTIGHNLLPV